jgi:thiomorpholine-carboxylate dehydrogenase
LASIEGAAITELRTAAVSAVATRLLARPNSQILAVLGSGAQARSHLQVFTHMQKFEEIRIWGRNAKTAKTLADEFGITQVESVQDAVQNADVVVGASSSKLPILHGEWLKKGAHVSSVGAFGPTNRELDDTTMSNIVIVDSRNAAATESGDIALSGAVVYAELGELLAGTTPVPEGRTTVFKSVGMAVEDVAAARLIYSILQNA